MNGQNTTGASKSVIGTAKVHTSDPVLPEGRGTHDTGLDSHVEIGGLESSLGIALEHFCNGQEFGMAGSLLDYQHSNASLCLHRASRVKPELIGGDDHPHSSTDWYHSCLFPRSCHRRPGHIPLESLHAPGLSLPGSHRQSLKPGREQGYKVAYHLQGLLHPVGMLGVLGYCRGNHTLRDRFVHGGGVFLSGDMMSMLERKKRRREG